MKTPISFLFSIAFAICSISCGTNTSISTNAAPIGNKKITAKPNKGAIVVYFPEYWHFYGPVGFHVSLRNGHKSPLIREGQIMVFDTDPGYTTISTEASSYAKGWVKAGEVATSTAGMQGFGIVGDISTRAKKQAELTVEKRKVYYYKISRDLVRETLVPVPESKARNDIKSLRWLNPR